jgi:hypothetical protein
MTATHTITDQEMGRMLECAARVTPWVLPVLNALREGHIGVTFLFRGQRAPLADMRRSSLPMVGWIGDDDGASTGPDGWRPALAVARWARSAMVHAAGGEARHYAAAVGATIITGRLLLIETSSAHARAWAKLMEGKHTLAILPRDGVHPVAGMETRH